MMATVNSPGSVFADVGSLKTKKNSMNLDFGSAGKSKTKTMVAGTALAVSTGGILASPDLAMLKMASPELEKMIIAQQQQQQQQQQASSATSTMSLGITPTQFLNPKNVSEEQERFASGFLLALEQLQKTGQPVEAASASSSSSSSAAPSTGASTLPPIVTAVDSAKAGPLPSASGEVNLTMLSTASSGSSTSSSSVTSSTASSEHSPPFFSYSPPTSDLRLPTSDASLRHHHSQQLHQQSRPSVPRPMNLTQHSLNNNNGGSNNNGTSTASTHRNVPSATLVTSLPGASVLSLSHSSSQQQQHHPLHQQPQQIQHADYAVAYSSSPASQGRPQLHRAQHPQQGSLTLLVSTGQNSTTSSESLQASVAAVSSASSMSSAVSSVMIPQTVFAHERLIQLKSEPDLGCSSSSGAGSPPPSCMSPINMETQEKIKLERKRARNRLAATKCRKRKLDRISHLEGRVNDLKDKNSELSEAAAELRNHVSELKKQILQHCQSGCNIASFKDFV